MLMYARSAHEVLLHKMLTIHRQPTSRTLRLPPELLQKVITWVIAQSVHSICILSDDVEWELESMETLCLVSSGFREIALKVACKAFGIQHKENHLSCPRYACDCDDRCPNVTSFSSSSSSEPATAFARLWFTRQNILKPSIIPPIKDNLVSGYTVYMAVINLRLTTFDTFGNSNVFQKVHQTMLMLLENALTHCRKIEPAGVADLLKSSLNDEIDILRIGTVLTSYLGAKYMMSSQSTT